ncbi:hypothetical protein FNV43_RR04423 [Rhamnella rubrinervis]|uniref:FACT complex subunit n=1 Tax=Rhamnella rubrinervis TaxID=2594499 RepID=A0A8K0MPJ7_9ROSA|nr:hypothetical protein FNV43_RR04423 [Rhamnella rubrinervis]
MADHRNGNRQPPNGKATGAGNDYTIDLSKFSIRLKTLYSHWNEHKSDLWTSSDVLAIATPPPSEDLWYLKSSALNIWLLGYEFPETIMVFMQRQIHFLCSVKKATLLDVVKAPAKDAVGVEVVMHVKAKNDDGSTLMEAIFRAIRAQSKLDGHDCLVVGYIAKEVPEGKLLETWAEKLKTWRMLLMRKKVTHSALMEETEKAILDPSKAGAKLKSDNVDICYPPIFQSGGQFDLRPSAASNDELLYYDSTSVIICAVGSRYKSYCSNVARTFLIDANPLQSKAYEVLLKAHEAAINDLKSGNKVSAAYQAAFSVVEKDAPELVPNLTKSAGTGIGLEFRESGLNLNAKNDRVVKAGMVFNVSLGFQNLQNQTNNTKKQNFSLLLADTVIVDNDKTEVVTSKSSKAVKDVAYSFNEDEEEEEEKSKRKDEANGTDAFMSKTTLRSDNHEVSKEELRRQHQAELARQKNEETARRLAGGGSGTGDNRSAAKTLTDLIAYKTVNDLPPPKDLMIQIDQKNEAVLFPIYGSMVPFHVGTIRTVSSQQDTNRNCYIRIIFNVPGTPFSPHDASSMKFQGSIYLKEVSFRSKDPRHISEVVQQIKTLRRQVVARESERAERATLVTQERLQLAGNRFKPIRRMSVEPQFSGLDLEFDQPLRELGFHGVPYKSSAFIVPSSTCLVELIETPFLVVTLSEIEIVNLERVGLGQKNFDMTIVFKDFKKDVLRIDSIPSTALDGIKEWLDTTDIKYYESRLNLNWRQILKTITDDPQSFIDEGGWEFLNLEATDSESDHSEESDQGYEPSDVEPESDSEEDDSDGASLVESEDEEEDDSEEDSEEEKGKTWEELEREASNADREKGNESDSEEDRKRRKVKAASFGKSRARPGSSRPGSSVTKRSKLR